MFCPNCGKQIPDDARFCGECGNTIEAAAQNPQPQQVPQFTPNFNNAGYEGYGRQTHPYHKLGGWLGFLAYVQLVGVGLLTIACIVSLVQLAGFVGYLGAGIGGMLMAAQIIELIGYGVAIFIGIKFFLMIKNRNPRFFRFYEILILVCVAIYFVVFVFTVIIGFSNIAEFVGSIIGQAIGFAIWSTYFRKSVRVRTYFGSDEYLRCSIFFKNAVAPMPADAAPFNSPPPYPQSQQSSQYANPQSFGAPGPQTSYAGSVPGSAAGMTQEEFCGKCGVPFKSGEMFCSVCGEKRAAAAKEL
jgi:predicted nucleic acid-binding Zn ribbon protein